MRNLTISFTIVVIAMVVFVLWWTFSSKGADILPLSTFIVVAFTLIVLVWYAYDTHVIATVTQARWKREEAVLSTTFGIDLLGDKGQAGRTLFKILNPSTLIVRGKVACNFRVYNESVTAGALYDGQDVWLLFPQQQKQGWFEVESLLQKKGKTVAAMIAECSPTNREDQLTMKLELEFWDETGARRKLPPQRYYFDFERWAWIPQLADISELP